jgi:hypothetical protein
MAPKALISAGLLAAAAAQNSPPGGTVGVWDHIQPNNNAQGINPYPGSPTNPLAGGLWPKSAFGAAAVWVGGNDANNNALLFGFDVVNWVWQPMTAALANFEAADTFFFGGFAIAAGGGTDDMSTQLAFMQTTAGPNAPWMTATMSGVPTSHDGHRFAEFGGILYMLGGLTNDPTKGWEYSNAMWASDLAGFFASVNNGPGDPNANLSWFKVQGINAPGMFSPRSSFTINVYSGTIIVFGGLTHTLPPPNGPDPVCALPGSNCNVYNDVWMYQPGLQTKPLDATLCSADQTANCGWSQVAVGGTTLPPGRYGSASGVLADNLYIFGGVDARGNFLQDRWVFNIEDAVWTQAQSTFKGISALPPVQSFFPSMSVVGHNLYVEMTGDAGGHAIYRWVPEAPARSGGGGASNSGSYSGNDAVAMGHTAGITLGVLLAIANLAVLAMIARHQGIELASCLGGGHKGPGAGAFYSSAAGDYTAPA